MMRSDQDFDVGSGGDSVPPGTPLSANALQLSGREWLVVVLIVVAIDFAFGGLHERIRSPRLPSDYRVPYALTDHYDLYERYSTLAAPRFEVLLVGDSVVWGQCCEKDQTLAHHLNSLAGSERFANLGLDGMHPVALALLLEYHAPAIKGKQVVLQCNPLWYISAGRRRAREEFLMNRPHLRPRIGPDLSSADERILQAINSAVAQTALETPLRQLASSFTEERLEVLSWTLEHPYENPLQTMSYSLPAPEKRAPQTPLAFLRARSAQNAQWDELELSSQWREFKHTVEILENRGNRVFVLVGPFNEAMLSPSSRSSYAGIKRQIEQWCQIKGLSYAIPDPLPPEDFADVCHPNGEGYLRLAHRLRAVYPRPFALAPSNP